LLGSQNDAFQNAAVSGEEVFPIPKSAGENYSVGMKELDSDCQNLGLLKDDTTQQPAASTSDFNPTSQILDRLQSSPDDTEITRPKSPWTPSYSVITQGHSPFQGACDEEVDDLEKLSPLEPPPENRIVPTMVSQEDIPSITLTEASTNVRIEHVQLSTLTLIFILSFFFLSVFR
jgi:hypothetical protein